LEDFWFQCPACAGTFLLDYGAEPEEESKTWNDAIPNLRRDCEPHRALWISLFGTSSLVLGSMALLLCGVPALAGIPLGIAAWLMGNHDLKQMRQGLMDPEGFFKTQRGRESGILGVVLGGAFLAGYTLFFLLFLF
jgi:hypothetical protein